jgi:hypothetical protein
VRIAGDRRHKSREKSFVEVTAVTRRQEYHPSSSRSWRASTSRVARRSIREAAMAWGTRRPDIGRRSQYGRKAAAVAIGIALNMSASLGAVGARAHAEMPPDCLAVDSFVQARLSGLMRRYDIRSSPVLQSALDQVRQARELCATGRRVEGLVIYKSVAELLADSTAAADRDWDDVADDPGY